MDEVVVVEKGYGVGGGFIICYINKDRIRPKKNRPNSLTNPHFYRTCNI